MRAPADEHVRRVRILRARARVHEQATRGDATLTGERTSSAGFPIRGQPPPNFFSKPGAPQLSTCLNAWHPSLLSTSLFSTPRNKILHRNPSSFTSPDPKPQIASPKRCTLALRPMHACVWGLAAFPGKVLGHQSTMGKKTRLAQACTSCPCCASVPAALRRKLLVYHPARALLCTQTPDAALSSDRFALFCPAFSLPACVGVHTGVGGWKQDLARCMKLTSNANPCEIAAEYLPVLRYPL